MSMEINKLMTSFPTEIACLETFVPVSIDFVFPVVVFSLLKVLTNSVLLLQGIELGQGPLEMLEVHNSAILKG